MKLRYKYLLVNIVWWLILSTLINIIFYIKINDRHVIINKVLLILLLASSLLSQLDASKKDDKEFNYGFYTMMQVFYGVLLVFFVGWVLVIIMHCFFDYQSFYFKKYFFSALVGLTFSVCISRAYLSAF